MSGIRHLTTWMLIGITAAMAGEPPARRPSKGDNLARGRLCSFSHAPNYSYCKDPDDAKQLTDGSYNGCVWTDK